MKRFSYEAVSKLHPLPTLKTQHKSKRIWHVFWLIMNNPRVGTLEIKQKNVTLMKPVRNKPVSALHLKVLHELS
jgi:hypothetical protein